MAMAKAKAKAMAKAMAKATASGLRHNGTVKVFGRGSDARGLEQRKQKDKGSGTQKQWIPTGKVFEGSENICLAKDV